jgi:glycosyltransferase involved in cell wall biosynthesis
MIRCLLRREAMMRIAIDIRPVLRERTGVGTYVFQLLRALVRADLENRYLLFSSSWKDRVPKVLGPFPPNFAVREFPVPVRILNSFWHRLRFPPVEFFVGEIDIAHSPHPLLLPARKRAKTIVTVHDLYFLKHPEWASGEVLTDYVPLTRQSLEKADAVVTVSEFTRKDCIECCGIASSKVHAIHSAVDESCFEPASGQEITRVRERYDIPNDFILTVGALEPRKNFLRLIEAFHRVAKRHPRLDLVIAGPPGSASDTIRVRIAALRLEKSVRLTGYVSAREMRALYRASRMLAFPSLYEGFGFPLLEAMAAGAPVLSSNSTAIPEIAADAALLVDPESTDAIEAGMLRILEDPALAARLETKGMQRAREFSWESTATALLQLYGRLGS